MFTTSCYIRKDTPELITKLKELGYKYVHQHKGDALSVYDGGILRLFLFKDETINGIDCGENEDLFLAIAALRNDTDKNQYFINNDIDLFVLCTEDKFSEDSLDTQFIFITGDQNLGHNWHKANYKELINYFNKK